MSPEVAVIFVLIGCCTNVVFLELLITEDPGSGNLITFAQFVFIAAEGFIVTMEFGRRKPRVPLKTYTILVVMFFLVNVVNNYALNFNISMPLHMIFRSGSLMANMVMGIVILKKRYKMSKYTSVGMITLGIVVCTIESGKKLNVHSSSPNTDSEQSDMIDYLWWCWGILLLTFALFMSARMGIYQEVIYKEHGKHPREALFFTHMLPLPGFLLILNDIMTHASTFNKSSPFTLLSFITLPKMWLWLMGNVATQYLCIRSVYVLTTEYSSLAVTLVVTLRKFLSLVFSIFYFGNPFTSMHWLGTTLVFVGTLLFADISAMIKERTAKKSIDAVGDVTREKKIR